ncbi:MAG: hypothetical protein N2662_07260 [Bacteroidales bacterium]|nr:hypothetical protein [Bacteroidales bacterium]
MRNLFKYKKTILLSTILLMTTNMGIGQTSISCSSPNLGDYTIDGQSYSLTFDEKPKVSIYLVFFKGFDYRLNFCSPQLNNYRITLYDIEKKILFSELCEQNEKSLDFRFESNLAAIVEISQRVENEAQFLPGEIRLTVGFKENKQVQFK